MPDACSSTMQLHALWLTQAPDKLQLPQDLVGFLAFMARNAFVLLVAVGQYHS
jgi:hypothetical protein